MLLFISLVGCLTPRLLEHVRSLRAKPVAAPRNLTRLPKHHDAEVTGDADAVATDVIAAAARVGAASPARDGDVVEISAEKGYLREFGNIVFHFSLLALLVAVAAGKLFGYEGNVIVIADGGPGSARRRLPRSTRSARATPSTARRCTRSACGSTTSTPTISPSGQALSFAANIDYQAGADLNSDTWRHYRLEVNHPLRLGGDRIYLQGHGYAPTFTVTFPDGQTRTQTVQWRPDDPFTLLSSGVIRVDPPGGTYPDAGQRRKNQIAIQGLFAPTEQLARHAALVELSRPQRPRCRHRHLPRRHGLDTGRPQSLFSLDPRLIEQKRLDKQARVNLRAGESTRLDDGTVIRFDGAVPFINLQVSHDPAQVWVLVSADDDGGPAGVADGAAAPHLDSYRASGAGYG